MNEARAAILAELERRRKEKSFSTFVQRTWPDFVSGWFYEHLFAELEQFARDMRAGLNPRLMLTVPPRHGKTETVAVRFPRWMMAQGLGPIECIYATYSAEQANRVSTKAREITIPKPGSGTKREWSVGDSVYRAAGVGGGLTGTGADLLIIDDPVKNAQEADSAARREAIWDWYEQVLLTRLSPKSGQILIMTRWHDDDLAGRLERLQGTEWRIITYKALAEKDEQNRKEGDALHEERFSRALLEQTRRHVTTRTWSALFQQEPMIGGGNIIKLSWFKEAAEHDIPPCTNNDVISVDANFKKGDDTDDVAIQRWRGHGPDCYLIDTWCFNAGFVQTMDTLLSIIRPSDSTLLIEDKANGSSIIDMLKQRFSGVIAINPTESKASRLQAVSSMFCAGNVHFGCECQQLKDQLLRFPACAHDDEMDACTQFLLWYRLNGVPDMQVRSLKQWWEMR